MHAGRQKKPKKTKVKKEKIEIRPPGAPPVPDTAEKDLTHYIKDRVELMKQIFAVLKDRELLAMAPQCLRILKVDDLQELCLEEVLGISSKRLHSILDGYDCPSDTDSSAGSGDGLMDLETISLDSISSDEAPLSAKPKKKSRHSRRKTKAPPEASAEAPPAGMTVLELLELQARARAIRAQLQAVRVHTGPDVIESNSVSPKVEEISADDEVVIKEEPPEVVNIGSSSDDENKTVKKKSSKSVPSSSASSKDRNKTDPPKSTSTLVISMPAAKVDPNPPRKIKLNRNNLVVSVSNRTTIAATEQISNTVIDLDKTAIEDKVESAASKHDQNRPAEDANGVKRPKNKGVGKVTKKNKSTKKTKSTLDEDEIMLDLSDTEKMDLLDSFNSSDTSSDSGEQSEQEKSDTVACEETAAVSDDTKCFEPVKDSSDHIQNDIIDLDSGACSDIIEEMNVDVRATDAKGDESVQSSRENRLDIPEKELGEEAQKGDENTEKINKDENVGAVGGSKKKNKKSKKSKSDKKEKKGASTEKDDSENVAKKKRQNNSKDLEESQAKNEESTGGLQDKCTENEKAKSPEANLSEGECSYSSDGIEITELEHEVVCISESSVDSVVAGKPKKKRYRKRRKSASSSATSDHPETNEITNIKADADNIDKAKNTDDELGKYEDLEDTDEVCLLTDGKIKTKTQDGLEPEKLDKDLMDYEVFEISDDSSGDEGGNCLSKEPTAEEIEELSKKIDCEIEREEIVFEKSITGDVDDETRQEILKSVGVSGEELSINDSNWKCRWLKSDKVKKVLATSNLCNALRKKNKEIKIKLVESKAKDAENKKETKEDEPAETGPEPTEVDNLKVDNPVDNAGVDNATDVGSVDFYMTLPSCVKYVDPAWAQLEEQKRAAMATDAHQLMRMYKKLLKIHRRAERDKGGKEKRKKKKKDKKDKQKRAAKTNEKDGANVNTSRTADANPSASTNLNTTDPFIVNAGTSDSAKICECDFPIVNIGDSSNVDSADSTVVKTSDSADFSVLNTAVLNTADSSNVNTSDFAILNTTDFAIVNNADSALVSTADSIASSSDNTKEDVT